MTGTETLKIVFVCTGNICRSAMADVMARDALEREGLLSQVRVESCGLGGWHVGQGADHRAVETLREHGLDGTKHRAKQYGPQFADANLFIVMDDGRIKERGTHDELMAAGGEYREIYESQNQTTESGVA